MRSKATVMALAGALVCASCTHQVQTASRRGSRTAVSAVMARHVENAVDAGEGNLEIRTLRQRLAADASDLDARVLLARNYSRRGLPDLALEHYRLAAVQFPDSVVVVLALAKTLREMGESEGALRTVQECLARHPRGNSELLSLEGILEDEQGRFAPAEAAHRAALALDSGRAALHNNLGYNLLLQMRPEAAAVEFRRAIAIDPRSEIAHNNLGTALASQSHPVPGEALSEWRRSADPAVAHNNLAAVLIEHGRFAEARSELEIALGFRRDFPAGLSNLRLVAERDGQIVMVPPASQSVNFWKRIASTWGKAVGGRPGPKAAGSSGHGADRVSASVEPAPSPEQASDAPVSVAGGK